MKKIVLIDGHNLLFRMFYGIPSSIKNTKGKEIKGLIGFIGSLKKFTNAFNPYSLYVIFDSETSKMANQLLDNNYKKNRKDYTNVKEEENPFTQLPLIKKALKYLKINYIEVEKNEADDYIASIVFKKPQYQYIIVSTDTDFFQLVNKNCFLYVPRGKKSILYKEKDVFRRYNILPNKYVLFKALVGDKSDNIKGIKRIGVSTASKILQYNSQEEFILKNPDSKITKILIENKKIIIKNIKLIKMNKNLDISNVHFNPLSNILEEKKTYEIIDSIKER